MSSLVVTAAPDRVFMRHGVLCVELTPVEARVAAQQLFEASNQAASAYDGCYLASVIRSWKRPDA